MNERIEKLARECFDVANDGNGDEYLGTTAGIEKFAKLIIEECLGIVNRKEYSYHEADPLWETAQLIKQHFGVTE
jgi:hypothetical protein